MSEEDSDNNPPQRAPYDVSITSDDNPVTDGKKTFLYAATCVLLLVFTAFGCAIMAFIAVTTLR